jgi:hypothetical protein
LPEGVDLDDDTRKTLYVVKDGKCVEKTGGEEEVERVLQEIRQGRE